MPALTPKPVEPIYRKDTCYFCPEETIVPAWRKKIVHHLVITIDDKNQCHVHGPLENPAIINIMLDFVKTEMDKWAKNSFKGKQLPTQ